MNPRQFSDYFGSLYGPSNPLLDDILPEMNFGFKDVTFHYTRKFELREVEPKELTLQIPWAFLLNPQLLVNLDELEIKAALELCGFRKNENPRSPYLLYECKYGFTTPDETEITFSKCGNSTILNFSRRFTTTVCDYGSRLMFIKHPYDSTQVLFSVHEVEVIHFERCFLSDILEKKDLKFKIKNHYEEAQEGKFFSFRDDSRNLLELFLEN
jgi:hypothetical protein